jgi:acetate kinase
MTDSSLAANATILTVNGGSSSLKFSLYDASAKARMLEGGITGITLPHGKFTVESGQKTDNVSRAVVVKDYPAAIDMLLHWIRGCSQLQSLAGIGHRVVHGGPTYSDPQRITPDVIATLRKLSPFDAEHLPDEILLIEALQREFSQLPQFACFDTAFHQTMPRVARLLPIPHRYAAKGVRRYGFHGLSYAYLMQQFGRLAGPKAANGRIVLAHLGNGASLAAVRDGRSVDTTMAFTPTAGLVMGTRCGDLDPGVVAYLSKVEGMSVARIDRMLTHESGLLGVSQISSDMEVLLAHESKDVQAAEAVELFCYQVKKWIGAYSAVLGGLDTLIFTGGIGENSAVIRARICSGLGYLGITIDETRNAAHQAVISVIGSKTAVHVIRTNEELMIAQTVKQLLESGA